jgi:hypothetical protein
MLVYTLALHPFSLTSVISNDPMSSDFNIFLSLKEVLQFNKINENVALV